MVWCDTGLGSSLRDHSRRGVLGIIATVYLLCHFADADCTGGMTSLNAYTYEQSLTSPSYPDLYHNNKYCRWILATTTNYEVIKFYFDDIAIRESTTCGDDYVEIKDGSDLWSPSIRKFCGYDKSNTNLTSSGSSIAVIFKTDGKYIDKGFKLIYWTVPKDEVIFDEVKLKMENYIILGLFGVILSSIIITMITIAVIHNVPSLYNKLVRGEIRAKPVHSLNGALRQKSRSPSEETICYSSRTVLESTSTLTSPI